MNSHCPGKDRCQLSSVPCQPLPADQSWLQLDAEAPQMEDNPLSTHQVRAGETVSQGIKLSMRFLH
jgi:hypothetical protein